MRPIFFLVPLLLLPQGDPADPKKRVEKLLSYLAENDPELRQSARAQLVAIGKEAVPEIEKKLNEKGALALAGVLVDIDRNRPTVEPHTLPPEEGVAKGKVDRDLVDKYVRSKYDEALDWARRNHFQRAADLSKAIHDLEPRSSIDEKVQQLRRFCDDKITQTTFLEATIHQEKPAFAVGEAVELTLRLKDVYRNVMTLKYETVGGGAPAGLAIVEIEASVKTLRNESESRNRNQELPCEAEIRLAPGQTWERSFRLDTSFGFADDVEVQTLVVSAWTYPSRIETDGVNITRRLLFEPATIKIVPKRYAHLLEKPLEQLPKVLESKPAQEAWVLVQLLAGDQKRRGAELLVKAMEKPDDPRYVPVLEKMLTELTGQRFGTDVKKWSEWLAKQPEKKK